MKNDSYFYANSSEVFLVLLTEIEEPVRDAGFPKFRSLEHYEKIRNAILNGVELPPIEVRSKNKSNTEKYIVYDGFHRYQISKELGFTKIPVRIQDWDMYDFFKKEESLNLQSKIKDR